eukprot:CAMPEP_0113505316 /NCGR_PEP_ID=MMETSP0014_2-20120614/35243_1 /TAXON_ID=2857 /ORGANISM="Nitzschia sp." /LENGTH=323 /DNA_ID=CAMNT_0000400603 /DNA_START=389 /DNA_END=1360 /DNA_ORIENTATION=- /assembly_acc=CAM_ASM_000159
MDPKSLQAEYEAFMLGGKNKATSTSTSTSTKHQQNRHKKKSYQPGTPNSNDNYDRDTDIRSIFKSYQGRLKEWLENDELLLKILESISHLRERFRWETKEIMSSSSGEKVQTNNDWGFHGYGCEDCDVCNVSTERGWKNYGFRSSMANRTNNPTKSPNKTSVLLRQDIELALDYDVLQHEKMMSGLRSVLRSTGQNIDAIGRRLDEWMIAINHEEQQHHNHRYSSQRLMKWKHQLESAQELFVSLSKDLFWKQKALEQIVSSYHDRLLVVPSDSTVSLKESPSNHSYNQNGMLLSPSWSRRRNGRVKGGDCSIRSSIEEVLDL